VLEGFWSDFGFRTAFFVKSNFTAASEESLN